ncbi:MAG TPA: AraC family transcriptional regulator [Epsilonproteobacteria bacterium]|nr:AraC family transcriptional regulator [Campylobacterota bacterium]
MPNSQEKTPNPIQRTSLDCFDGDAMTAMIEGTSLNLYQVEKGAFETHLFSSTLGNGLINGGYYSRSVLTEGILSQELMSCSFLNNTSKPGILEGKPLEKNNILLSAEDAPLDCVMAAESQWTSFQFKREDMLKTGLTLPTEGSLVFKLSPEAEEKFLTEMNQLLHYIQQTDEANMVNTDILYQHLVSHFSYVLEETKSVTYLKAKESTLLAKKLYHYIHENASFPIQMMHLTELIGKSERTVERIFKQYFSLSPYAYLKVHRLHLIRNKLLSMSTDSSTNITHIAMENGFMSMGYFSREYRKLFNETPTETLNKRD